MLVAAGAMAAALMAFPDPLVIPIRTWGAAIVASLCAGYLIQRNLARRNGVPAERVFDLWFFGGLTGLASGRMLHVALNWRDYATAPFSAFAFWDGGLVWLGSALGYVAYTAWDFRRHRLPLRLADDLAVGFAIGHGLSRIGCFLGGCCWGRNTSMPWGVQFPPGSVAYETMRGLGRIPDWRPATPAVHPTQLYEAAVELAIGAILFSRLRRNPPPGSIAALWFVLYPAARIVLETFRDDPDRGSVLLLSTSQALSLGLVTIAAFALARIHTRG